jgi:hypothetical protein
MRNPFRRRFWLETGIATGTGIGLVLTLIGKDWIEIVFGVDPDQGNGTLERLIVGTLVMATITLFTLAGYEWRRTWATIS